MNDPFKAKTPPAEVEFRLAYAWQRQRNFQRALAGYRRVLEFKPDHLQAHIELVTLLLQLKRIPEAEAAARHALDLFPNEANQIFLQFL